jgi:hypothetical protein
VAGLSVGGSLSSFLAAPDGAGCCAGGQRLVAAAWLADPRLDPTLVQRLFELARGVAAVGPQLGRLDPALQQRVDERQQVPALVLVPGRQPHLQRPPGRVDG